MDYKELCHILEIPEVEPQLEPPSPTGQPADIHAFLASPSSASKRSFTQILWLGAPSKTIVSVKRKLQIWAEIKCDAAEGGRLWFESLPHNFEGSGFESAAYTLGCHKMVPKPKLGGTKWLASRKYVKGRHFDFLECLGWAWVVGGNYWESCTRASVACFYQISMQLRLPFGLDVLAEALVGGAKEQC